MTLVPVTRARAGGVAVVHANGTSIAVFEVDDEPHAFVNRCPHRGGPIADGPVSNGVVMCPWHGWKFDLRTGQRIGRSLGGGAGLCPVALHPDGDDLYVVVEGEASNLRG